MKRAKRWKLSPGGAGLFLAFLFVPLIGRCLYVVAIKPIRTWIDAIILLAVLFLAAILWFSSVRPLASQGTWKLPRSWYKGCFALAVLFLLYAAFIVAFGRTPSRYHSRPVPRHYALYWLEAAALPALAGGAAFLVEKRKRRPD